MPKLLKRRILALAPHADDIEIGMGGSIARFIDEGYDVKIINVTLPIEDSNGDFSLKSKDTRLNEAYKSAQILGATMEVIDINPYELSHSRELVNKFDKIVKDYNPSDIFMTWEHDSHQDHQILAKIIYSATRKNHCSLYMYETMIPWGISTEAFRPQLFINISEYIDKKRQSIEAYESVFGHNEISEAILGRASFRGSQIGVKYAEAFEIVKDIVY